MGLNFVSFCVPLCFGRLLLSRAVVAKWWFSPCISRSRVHIRRLYRPVSFVEFPPDASTARYFIYSDKLSNMPDFLHVYWPIQYVHLSTAWSMFPLNHQADYGFFIHSSCVCRRCVTNTCTISYGACYVTNFPGYSPPLIKQKFPINKGPKVNRFRDIHLH